MWNTDRTKIKWNFINSLLDFFFWIMLNSFVKDSYDKILESVFYMWLRLLLGLLKSVNT